MSLFETGDSDGTVSLQGLFRGEFKNSRVQTDLRRLATNKTILTDVKSNHMDISEQTLYSYINAYVIPIGCMAP